MSGKRKSSAVVVVLGVTLLFSVSCRRVTDTISPEEPSRQQRKHHGNTQVIGPFDIGPWDSTEREKFGRLLQEYLGTPYQGASQYQEGIDCSRFTSEVYRRYNGLRLPRVARDQAHSGEEVSRSHIRYGDLVFFAIGGKRVSHVGIYVGDNHFIHASSSRGVVIDDMSASYWRKYYHSARRVVFTDKEADAIKRGTSAVAP